MRFAPKHSRDVHKTRNTMLNLTIQSTLRRALAATLAGSALLAATLPAKADFPERPVKLVVPFAAGLPPDALGRIVGDAMGKRLKTAVLIENRPGANGNIGTEAVARAPADGYTLLVCGLTCATANAMYKQLRFNVKNDLVPVGNIGAFPSVLVVSAQSPHKSLAELVKYAKEHPKEVTFASAGSGGSPHLAGEQLRRAAGIDITHVPYGTSDPLIDVAAGRVDFMFIPGVAAAARKEQLRALAVATGERIPSLPEIPTLEESGYKGFRMEAWNALWAPKGTPEAVLTLLSKVLRESLADPDVQGKLAGTGIKIIGGTRAQMAAYFDADAQRWVDVAKAANIQLD